MRSLPLAFPLLVLHAGRRLRKHWPGSLLLISIVALACAVGVAVLYAAEASLTTFTRSIGLLRDDAVELRHTRGWIEQGELASFYRFLWPTFETHIFLRGEGSVKLPNAASTTVHLIGVDPLEANNEDDGAGLANASDVILSPALAALTQTPLPAPLTLIIEGQELVITAGRAHSELTGNTIAFPLVTLQRLLNRPGQITGIRLRARSANEHGALPRLRSTIGQPGPFRSLLLVDQGDRRERVSSLLAAFRLNIGVMVLMTGLVCALALFNATSLSVLEIQPELRTMRAIGFHPWSIVIVVLLESTIIGICGALVGTTIGRPVSIAAAALFLTSVSAVYLPGESFADLSGTLSLDLVLTALAGGIAVALVGGVIPALAAARTTPFRWPMSWRALFALTLAATAASIALAIQFHEPLLAQLSAVLIVLSLGVTALPATRALTALLQKPIVKGLGMPGLIAMTNVSASARRAAVSVAASAAAVCLLIGLGVMIESFRGTLAHWISYTVRADLFIRSSEQGQRDAPAWLPAPAQARLEAANEFTSVIRYAGIEIPFRNDWVVLGGADLPTKPDQREYQFLNGGLDHAELAAGRAILVSETAARRFNLHSGDNIALQDRSFLVAGVYRDYSETRGILLLDLNVFRQLTGIQRILSVAAHVQPGIELTTLQRKLQVDPHMAGTTIQENRELRSSIMQIFDDTFRVTGLIRLIVLIICAAGFVVTILQLVWERRRELRTLEMLGTSRRQLRAAILGEGTFLALGAALIGIPAGLALALVLIYLVNPLSFGWTLSLTIPLGALMVPPALVLGAGMAGAAVAGMFHLRVIQRTPITEE